MTWSKIMKIQNPNEAMLKIAEKIDRENLSIEKMEDAIFRYARRHRILPDEMAYYPNGDNVMAGYKKLVRR